MCFIKIHSNLINLNWKEVKNPRYIGEFLLDEKGLLYKLGKKSIEKVIFKEHYITKLNIKQNEGVKFCNINKCIYPESIDINDWLKDQKITKKNINKNLENKYKNQLYPYN